MHQILRRIRYAPSRLPSNSSANARIASPACPPARSLPPTALVFPSVIPGSPVVRLFKSETTQATAEKPWSEASSNKSPHPSKPLEWNKDGGLGQGESQWCAPRHMLRDEPVRSEASMAYSSYNAGLILNRDDPSLPELRKLDMRSNFGVEEAWSYFLELHDRGDFSEILDMRSETLRHNILKAALNDPTRMMVFYDIAKHLRDQFEFEWPEIYARIIHFYLGHANYEAVHMWHIRLMPIFTPTLDEFQTLLSSFAIDPTRELQDTLKKIYVLSPLRRVYDYLIPTLFEYGQSQTARAWRKRLVLYGDFPSHSRSLPFLKFCTRYYPLLPLSEKEMTIINGDSGSPTELEDVIDSTPEHHTPKGIYSDSFTARWFASPWASIEFAVNLMYKLGLKVIGPRSLQSLALREESVDEVASRIAELERLGIDIAQTTYCKALVTFAKERQQDLLTELVHCDVHPDEFDDKDTRRMLIEAARRRQDEKQEQLLYEVESIALGRSEAQKQTPPRDLNKQLEMILVRGDLGRARLLLDKMEFDNTELSHPTAMKLLERVFQSLWYFPKKVRQKIHGKGQDPELDRAIHIIRRVAQHDVAIPLKWWRIILYNLGRLERFDEFEELSHEIIDLYTSTPGGLLPVHRDDLPSESKPIVKQVPQGRGWTDEEKIASARESDTWPGFFDESWRDEVGLGDPDDTWQRSWRRHRQRPAQMQRSEHKQKRPTAPDVVHFIPSDLPISNQQHPVAKLFDSSLQRAIVRWSFDKKIASPPATRAHLQITTLRSANFDIVWGVHFLAKLRDRGLHINTQVLKSVLISRISVAQVPGRSRHRSRDERELSPANLKHMINEAWGMELLPTLPHFSKQLEDYKPRLWSQYWILMRKAYDPPEPRSTVKKHPHRRR